MLEQAHRRDDYGDVPLKFREICCNVALKACIPKQQVLRIRNDYVLTVKNHIVKLLD